MAQGSTSFPQPIALATTWDPEFITRVFTAGALETRARGSHQVLGPNLDLARDARWGRTEETYGEDPYLTSRMAVAIVKALQGPGPNVDENHVIATAKHFTAHGQPESGTNIAPVNFSERALREYYLPSFKAAVTEAGIMSVMPSYNEIDGVPSHANKWLLQKVLRDEWGFKGHVVSDYYAIPQMMDLHHLTADKAATAKLAIEAGVDAETPDPDSFPLLIQLVKEGKVSEETINQAVARNLRAKFLLGLFENPYVDVERAARVTNSAEHQALAAEAARRSITLLKNENNLLPLNLSTLKSIAVIGPRANEVLLDWYSGTPPYAISPLEGIKNAAGESVKVNYAANNDGGAAVKIARESDVAIVCVGNHPNGGFDTQWAKVSVPSEGREAVDRQSITLEQEELIKAVLQANPRTIVVLKSSFPYAINWTQENVPAIVHMALNSQEEGRALATVLFGDYNPAGRLVQTWPRSLDQLPPMMDYDIRRGRTYMYFRDTPLYPFGYGLSYTTFAYRDLTTNRSSEIINVSVTVKNTGRRAGDEVVQLYLKHIDSAVTRPLKELADFKRVHLAPQEEKTVKLSIPTSRLAYWNTEKHQWVVEKDQIEITVGGSSTDTRLRKTIRVL